MPIRTHAVDEHSCSIMFRPVCVYILIYIYLFIFKTGQLPFLFDKTSNAYLIYVKLSCESQNLRVAVGTIICYRETIG